MSNTIVFIITDVVNEVIKKKLYLILSRNKSANILLVLI